MAADTFHLTRIESKLDAVHDLVANLEHRLATLQEPSPHADVVHDAHTAPLGPSDVGLMLGVSTRTLRRLRKQRRFPRPVRGSGRRPKWTYLSIARYMEGG